MLSNKDFERMSKIVEKDIENKAFVYSELDEKPHIPKTAVCGNPFNATVLIASLINMTIDRLGVSRLEYMHDLNQMLKEVRGEK